MPLCGAVTKLTEPGPAANRCTLCCPLPPPPPTLLVLPRGVGAARRIEVERNDQGKPVGQSRIDERGGMYAGAEKRQ